MKYLLSTVLATTALTLSAVSLAASQGPEFPDDSTMAKIQEKGTLVVGVKYDIPLFGQKNPLTDSLEGYEIEIGKRLGRDLFGTDGHVKFIEAPGPVREQFVNQRKADLVISTYTITDARLESVAFAGPIYESKQAVVVRKDSDLFGDAINGYEELDGHSVCVVTNSIANGLIKEKAPGAKIMALSANPDCAKAVRQGRVDIFATDDALLFGFVNETPDELRFVDNTGGEDEPYGIGVHKESLDLCDWVNERLLALSEEGFLEEIFNDSIGTVTDRGLDPLSSDSMKYCK